VIYPDAMAQEVLEAAKQNGFFLFRIQNVYDHKGGILKRRLFEFSLSAETETIQEPDLFLDALHEEMPLKEA
jgi:tRNA1(Val) A37 N6-methylase TrmN6